MICQWQPCYNELTYSQVSKNGKYCCINCKEAARRERKKIYRVITCKICKKKYRTSQKNRVLCDNPECRRIYKNKQSNTLKTIQKLKKKPVISKPKKKSIIVRKKRPVVKHIPIKTEVSIKKELTERERNMVDEFLAKKKDNK